MKRKNWLLFGAIALLIVAAVLVVNSANTSRRTTLVGSSSSQPTTPRADGPTAPAHDHPHPNNTRVPAFEVAPTRASLAPTLDPENFTGLTRDAYRAVRQIPVTIAQLPCYCHCDEGFGHKSLYSCFEDTHAAHCDVCVREALLALALEKQKLTPVEIRERIVVQYGKR